MDSLNGQRKWKVFLNRSLAAVLDVKEPNQDMGDQAGQYKWAVGGH